MKNKIYEIIGTGFYSGYIPFAPGTAGSLFAVAIFFIPGFSRPQVMLPLIIISFFVGIHIGNYFERNFGHDPAIFTFDEFVGTWIVLLVVPADIKLLALSFIIWRVLDIIKPFPANKAETLKGGFGIMLDDVVSGMYSLIIIYIFKFLFI